MAGHSFSSSESVKTAEGAVQVGPENLGKVGLRFLDKKRDFSFLIKILPP